MRREYGEVLALQGVTWAGPQLAIRWRVDEHQFATSLWYESVDWDELERRHGRGLAEALAFHIAMFEIDKGVSFGPRVVTIDPPWDRFVTDAFVELWGSVVRHAWAQWRYEHALPEYPGPRVVGARHAATTPSRHVVAGERALWFCGGGKDSLLASDVLTRALVPYDAFAYAHSTYGPAEPQMALVDRLVDHTGAERTHRLFVHDDAIDLPVHRFGAYTGVRYVLAAETPASVFAALPLAVTHGYGQLVVAHERSANAANLRWEATGEDVNHQWGKSIDAERLIDNYVRDHLLRGVRYYSVLAPVHDALIFGSLRAMADRFPLTHSCNVAKPWCLRCPKCAYVWICAVAWLPPGAITETFGDANLLDLPENQLAFRQMLGLESHTPFECIGQIDEVRLAFAIARSRGVRGQAMRHFDEVPDFDVFEVLDRYLAVATDDHAIPHSVAPRVLADFHDRAGSARAFAVSLLTEPAVAL